MEHQGTAPAIHCLRRKQQLSRQNASKSAGVFICTRGKPKMANVAMEARAVVPGSVRAQLQTLEDAELVASFLAGEERAFQEIVERYQTRLLNFIYRTIGDRERGEDLVQEVFIRVYRHMARFDRSKKFSTWIYTIASNLAKNELRNRSRNPLVFFQTIRKNTSGLRDRFRSSFFARFDAI